MRFASFTGGKPAMTREQAWPYASYFVDSALAECRDFDMPHMNSVRLVGWQCGFEPLFVAVWSAYGGVRLDDDDAIEIATDLLVEKKWFADEPTSPDYIL
jgi:hypothetical protein